jgi:hypothetical protein
VIEMVTFERMADTLERESQLSRRKEWQKYSKKRPLVGRPPNRWSEFHPHTLNSRQSAYIRIPPNCMNRVSTYHGVGKGPYSKESRFKRSGQNRAVLGKSLTWLEFRKPRPGAQRSARPTQTANANFSRHPAR